MWSVWVLGRSLSGLGSQWSGPGIYVYILKSSLQCYDILELPKVHFVPRDKLNAWRKKGQIKGSNCCIRCIGQAVTKGYLQHNYWIWKTLSCASECKRVFSHQMIILLLKIRSALIYQNPSSSCTLAVMADRNQSTNDAGLSSIWRWDYSEPWRWTVAKLCGSAGLALSFTACFFTD